MISKNPTESQVSPVPAAQAGAGVAPMDPGSIIETASTGTGNGNDQIPPDKPPGDGDLDPLLLLS
ncbi:MAG TPA: hypothetical protein VH988_33520 [Thermoanaerobaculia bacterium]|jgi:hypothetical protein|nr:hypothetical protein [Thermoanaerobaculia bacterium]